MADTNFSSLKKATGKFLNLPWKIRRRSRNKVLEMDSFSTMESSHQLRHVFKFLDSNGDGKISQMELSRVLLRLGKNKSLAAKEAEGMVKEMDRNGDGFVDMDEFMSVLIREEEDEENLIKDAFMVFDCDKNGYISARELQKVMVNLGCVNCSLKECRKMIHGVDRDGDGFVNFEEFKFMMTGFLG
ncbi:calmodulin-like protein 3 [Impatiens glandulifera]|uniref:calmodulin-like protein 3 n=1 Tax=Impatiens glandulifera TaxID=253017 RepID=UPI001FB0DD06|nr:calmodulin-like protein 3 [Impatiens glandulifera]